MLWVADATTPDRGGASAAELAELIAAGSVKPKEKLVVVLAKMYARDPDRFYAQFTYVQRNRDKLEWDEEALIAAARAFGVVVAAVPKSILPV